jgi:hypothetical protein
MEKTGIELGKKGMSCIEDRYEERERHRGTER